MAITVKYKDMDFGVGDKIRVFQRITEGEKTREQVFDGMVIAINNRDTGRSFTVRKVGELKIGIERIFMLESPTISDIKVLKSGVRGISQSKLYYVREKSQREIEKIYSRASRRNREKKAGK